MISARYPQVTDELLSAYIDNAVTEEEKALIEQAIVDESAIAWRLESLRYTVNLLHSLPALALPRSFVLSDLQVAPQTPAQPAVAPLRQIGDPRRPTLPRRRPAVPSFWEHWRQFWQTGNLFLRNAAAASLALFLFLAIGGGFVTGTTAQQRPAAVTYTADNRAPTRIASNAATQVAQAPLATVGSTATPPAQAEQSVAAAQTNTDTAANAAAPPAAVPVTAQAKGKTQANGELAQESKAYAQPPGPDNTFGGADMAPSAASLDSPVLSAARSAPQPAAMPVLTDAQTVAPTPTVPLTPTATATLTTSAVMTNGQGMAAIAAAATATIAKPTPTLAAVTAGESSATLVNETRLRLFWLRSAQFASACLTLLLGLLWWRSRQRNYANGSTDV